jgi:hypothetical protein
VAQTLTFGTHEHVTGDHVEFDGQGTMPPLHAGGTHLQSVVDHT